MPAVKAAVSPVSLTVNGADVGVPASNVSKAGEATGVGASVGVGDGDGDGDPDGEGVGVGVAEPVTL